MNSVQRLFQYMLTGLFCDSAVRAWLSKICWFTSVPSLEKDDAIIHDALDENTAVGWAQLWSSAGKLCASVYRPIARLIKITHRASYAARLHSRKRDELAFLFRISSLRQLMACHHASGASDDAAFRLLVSPQSTMRAFAIVLFLLPESDPVRSFYVYCLRRRLPDRHRSYLYGSRSA
ncbi:hypothetical protein [Enterobacter sp.]|uniref:hypothetical protein n=1 Tax=Enterobacter sp. TaxID=42895 RepID=UPI00296FBCF2|nr:hypothetical protein [Enterobacter sp.]